MNSTATKIIKNSTYGVFGKAKEPEELYCEYCLTKIEHWFMNMPIGCFECDKGVSDNYAKFITLEQVRELKIDDLTK